MQKLAGVFALGASLLMIACSGSSSSSPAAPSSSGGTTAAPAAPTTATATSTSTSGLFTFTFEAGTQLADQDLVRNAITSAASFFQTAVGRSVTQSTTITLAANNAQCAQPGASAATGQRNMVICGTNQGWTVHDSLNRQKILMHEAFHLVQAELRWNINPAQVSGAFWLVEGSAEYMGWRAAANQGLVSFTTAKGCMVQQASAQAPASANLDTAETAQGFGPGAYQIAMLGVDQLVTGAAGGAPALITYGTAIGNGTEWHTAFQNAFSTSTTAFYGQFVGYRASLASTASAACGT